MAKKNLKYELSITEYNAGVEENENIAKSYAIAEFGVP